jgi:phage-related protein
MRRRHGRITSIFRELLTPDPGLMRSLLHPLEKTLSIPLVAAIAAGIVGLGGGAIAAAISSVVLLGIGGLVLGGAGALLSEKLTPVFEESMGHILRVLTKAAAPLEKPFARAIRSISHLFDRLAPTIERIFVAAAPIIPLLVDTFATFAEKTLPTIEKMMPSVVKMFEILAARAPELADALSQLLLVMADEETIAAFSTLLTILVETIYLAAAALKWLTRSFNQDMEDIAHGADMASRAIETIKRFLGRIPTKTITKYLFQPGAALSWIGRVTGATKAIPKLWNTLYSFLGSTRAARQIGTVVRLVRAIPRAWQTVYRFLASIGPIRNVINWLARIPRNIVTTLRQNIIRTAIGGLFGGAAGGIIGARGMAAGGISGGRTVLVGERGPELAELPFGSRVVPAGQTRAALEAASGQGGPLVIHLSVGGRELAQVLVDPLRKEIRSLGGNVQAALGTR